MSYRLEFKTKAIKGLESLTSKVRERILRKICWLGENFDYLNP